MHSRFASPEELLENRDWILGLARTLVREPADAEDLAQEAMLAALQSPPAADRPLRAWLARVLANLVRRRWRSETRREQRERRAERRDRSEELSPADLVERIALQNDVAAAVLKLEEPYRSAIILRYFEMLAPAEIARRQGVSPESIRQRLKRGRERLRELLDSHYGDRSVWTAGLIALLRPPARRAPFPMKPLLAGASLLVLVSIWGSAWVLTSKRGGKAQDFQKEAFSRARTTDVARLQQGVSTDNPGRSAVSFEPARATMEAGQLEVLASWASDGAPAAGEIVLVRLVESDAPFPQDRIAHADGEGRAFFELPAGEVRVGLLRGLDEYAWVTIRPLERSEVRLAVPEGITVLGRVVDEAGEALPSAEIWLSECWNPVAGHAVALADEAGAFRVRSVQLDGGNWLVARADDHAASPAMHFEGVVPGEEIQVEIALCEGGSVQGITLDAEGLPIPGAEIQVGFESRTWAAGPGSPPCRTTSDAAGRFFLSGLALGRQPLLARALGYGPFTGEVEVGSIPQGVVSIALKEEARVEGVVTDAKGTAVSGASIGCGEVGAFASCTATSGGDGRFVLRGLASGRVRLLAREQDLGADETELELTPGGSFTWNPTLHLSPSIFGRILDERSEPFADRELVLFRGGSERYQAHWVQTDGEGNFAFPELADVDYTLVLHADDASFAALILRDVRKSHEPLALRLPDPGQRSASIHALVLDPSGDPVPATSLTIEHQELNWSGGYLVEPSTGAIEIAIDPGTVALGVRSESYPQLDLGRHELSPHERFDLGEVRLLPPAYVRGSIRGGADGLNRSLSMEWFDALGRRIGKSRIAASAYVSPPLGPGRCTVRLLGDSVAMQTREFFVEEGVDQLADITLQTVGLTGLELVLPEQAVRPVFLAVEAFDEKGELRWIFEGEPPPQGPLIFGVSLEDGRYRVRASTDTGLCAEGVLIADGYRGAAAEPLVLGACPE